MKAVTKILAGGVAAIALASAAPVTAQYYPGNNNAYPGQPYGGQGAYPGQSYGGQGAYGYGVNQQAIVNQCAAAVQQRLGGGGYPNAYRNNGYNGYGNGYQNGYAGGRVIGISRVEPRQGGGLTVRGVATSGRYGGAYGYNSAEPHVDLTWRCKTDYRGYIADIDINPAERGYGGAYNPGPYTPYNNDYSQYGYRRY